MEIARTRPESMRGPAEHFTGDVWLDAIVGDGPPRVAHPRPQRPLHPRRAHRLAPPSAGPGPLRDRGRGPGAEPRAAPVEAIRAGDTIRFDPDEEHWHGAAPATFMTHLALQEVDDEGIPAYWGEHVSDEEYGAGPG